VDDTVVIVQDGSGNKLEYEWDVPTSLGWNGGVPNDMAYYFNALSVAPIVEGVTYVREVDTKDSLIIKSRASVYEAGSPSLVDRIGFQNFAFNNSGSVKNQIKWDRLRWDFGNGEEPFVFSADVVESATLSLHRGTRFNMSPPFDLIGTDESDDIQITLTAEASNAIRGRYDYKTLGTLHFLDGFFDINYTGASLGSVGKSINPSTQIGGVSFINPVSIEGGVYYVVDADGDGVMTEYDKKPWKWLKDTFLSGGDLDSSGVLHVGGYSFEVASLGAKFTDFESTGGSVNGLRGTNWSNAVEGFDTNTTSNAKYNSLAAIWDAFNGVDTELGLSGRPVGWDLLYNEGHVWTSSKDGASKQMLLAFDNGNLYADAGVSGSDATKGYFVFKVL
jgi:hypothetical protein